MTRRRGGAISRRTFDQKTDVYRLYDSASRLLYVGVAVNGYARLETHRREKPWRASVRRVVMTQYGNRWTALYVEACAIRDESPIHNVSRNAMTAELPHRVGSLAPLEVDEFGVA